MSMMFRRAMLFMGGLVKKIVTSVNSIVSFITNVEMPTNIICEFGPVQDLHGYSNPWPAGVSVNRISDGTDTSNGYVSGKYLAVDGTETANASYYISEYFPVTAEATYTWSGPSTSNAASICFYDENKTFLSGIAAEQLLPKTFTVPTGAVYCRASQYVNFNGSGTSFQLQTGSSATTPRVPYSNVCPISGWTECEISHTNANILDAVTGNKIPASDSKVTVSDGVLTAKTNNTTEAGLVFPVLPNTQYTIGFNITTGGNAAYFRCAEYSAKPTTYTSNRIRVIQSSETALGNGTYRKVITTGDNAKYVFFGIYRSYNSAEKKINNWYANLGSTTSGYSAHEGETVPISWETDAGTVYGGTVTLNEDGSADLVSRAYLVSLDGVSTGRKVTDKGSSSSLDSFYFEAANGYSYPTASTWVKDHADWPYQDLFKCSHAPYQTWDITGDLYFGYCAYSSKNKVLQPRLHFNLNDGINTVAKCNNWLKSQADNNTPVWISYPVKTPVTYHFDNIGDLESFVGTNTVWHDMNGSITVEYYKNT